MEQTKEYFAFISYKREDKKNAKRLQHALEYYRLPNHLREERPELPEYIRPVFRDMTDLEVGELSAQIHAGLEQSHFLIVICSPRAAESKWVNDEIEYFISLGKQDKIIPYIIEGVPHASSPDEECYPPALLRLSAKKELLGANVNEVGKDSATIRVVSRMFNIRFDTLYQRYQREQKKRRLQITIAIVISFLFMTGIATWIWHQNILLKEREWKMKENQARAVAEKANQLVDSGDLTAAMMICLDIMPELSFHTKSPVVPELRSSLYDAFYKYLLDRERVICLIPTIDYHNNDKIDFGIVPGNKYVWSCSYSNEDIDLYDIQTGKLIHSNLKGGCSNNNQFSNDGRYYVSIDEIDNRIKLWDVSTGTVIKESNPLGTGHLWNPRLSKDNNKVFVEQDGTGIIGFELPTLKRSFVIHDIPGYCFVDNNNYYFADFDSNNVWIGNKESGSVVYEINNHINTCCFSDSMFAVSFSEDNRVYIYEFQTGKVIKQIKSVLTIDILKFSKDMRYLVVINRDDSKMELFDLLSNRSKIISLPNDMHNYSIDNSQDYLVFSSDIANKAYKYLYNTDSLILCSYFEAFPNNPYRVMRDGIQPLIKVFRAKACVSIKTTKIQNNPYLIEGEGYCLIENDPNEDRYGLVCEISDSLSLFVPSDSSSLVLYNKNTKHKSIFRRNVRNNYSIPINLLNKEKFAVFTKDSLLLYDKKTLELSSGIKIAISTMGHGDLYEYKSYNNKDYLLRPENNDYCIYSTGGDVITKIDGQIFENFDFSPSGRYLTCWKSSHSDTKLCILNSANSEIVCELEQSSRKLVSFDKSEKQFACLYGGGVAVFNIEKERMVNFFKGHVEEIEDIALSPSGKYLLTTCPREKCVKLWDVETGVTLYTFENEEMYSVRFSEDENKIIMSNHQGGLENYTAYAHSVISKKFIPFYSLDKLILKAKDILNNREITSEERRKYYLE